MADLFISYCQKNSDFVDKLCIELDAHGIEYWRDIKSFDGISNVPLSVNSGLVNSSFGLAVLSPEYFESNFCQAEFSSLLTQGISKIKNVIYLRHGLSYEYILKEYPIIASMFLLSSDEGAENIALKINSLISIQHDEIKTEELVQSTQPLDTLAVIDKEGNKLIIDSTNFETFYFLSSGIGTRYVSLRQMSRIHRITEDNILYNPNEHTITIFHGDRVIQTKLSSTDVKINGVKIPYDHKVSIVYEEKVYLSLSEFTVLLGCKIIENDSKSYLAIVRPK